MTNKELQEKLKEFDDNLYVNFSTGGILYTTYPNFIYEGARVIKEHDIKKWIEIELVSKSIK